MNSNMATVGIKQTEMDEILKKKKPTALTRIVCEIPEGFDLKSNYLTLKVGDSIVDANCSIERIKILKSQAEIDKRKEDYRKEYNEREEVKQRNIDRKNDEEYQARIKAYAEREDVKERKKETSAIKREVPNILKTKAPTLYREVLEEATKKRKTSNGQSIIGNGCGTCVYPTPL